MNELLHARGGDWLLVFGEEEWEGAAQVRPDQVVSVQRSVPYEGASWLILELRSGGQVNLTPRDPETLRPAYEAVCAAVGFTDTEAA
ncbi:MAG: hypothetical protein AAGH15_05245 [Myxococcota bacterium]